MIRGALGDPPTLRTLASGTNPFLVQLKSLDMITVKDYTRLMICLKLSVRWLSDMTCSLAQMSILCHLQPGKTSASLTLWSHCACSLSQTIKTISWKTKTQPCSWVFVGKQRGKLKAFVSGRKSTWGSLELKWVREKFHLKPVCENWMISQITSNCSGIGRNQPTSHC